MLQQLLQEDVLKSLKLLRLQECNALTKALQLRNLQERREFWPREA